jgi:aspartokinase
MLASNEKSITEAVREMVTSDLSFQDSLQRDYCNVSALARIIKPQIDHMLDKDTSIESIITALKRSRYDYDVPQKPIASILAASTITVNTDVAKISAKKSKKTIEKVAKAMVQGVGNFISISESIMSITLVFDGLLLQDVKAMFAYDDILKTPGCAIAFYNQLARRHINIEDTVSCYTDTIVLVKMEQVGKAFNALTDLISNSRKMAKKKHR